MILLASIAALLAASFAGAQRPTPAEVRTYIGESTATAVATDTASHRWNMTSSRRAYVCPICGWSHDSAYDSDVNPAQLMTCPNYYGHAAGINLMPKTLLERVAEGVHSSDGAPAACDAFYRDIDAAGNPADPHYWYIMGRPFVPNTARYVFPAAAAFPAGAPTYAGISPRSRVFCDVRGLSGFNYNGTARALPGDPGTNDRARFLCIPPGVKEPIAEAYFSTGLTDSGIRSNADMSNNLRSRPYQTGGATFFDQWQAGSDPTSQSPLYDATTNPDGYFEVTVNPHRVSPDDRYYVRYSCVDAAGGGPNRREWRLEVYSKLHGLEMDHGDVANNTNQLPQQDDVFLAFSGSVRLRVANDLPYDDDNNDGRPAVWVFTFRVRSNCRIIPSATLDRNQLNDYGDLEDEEWELATAGNDPNPGELADLSWDSWPYDGLHFRIAAAGNGSVADTQDVYRGENNTNQPNPYPFVIQPGEIGIGRVEVLWTNQEDDTHVPTVTADNMPGPGGGMVYYAETAEGCECWYDRYGQGSNDEVATGNANPDWPLGQQYSPIESRFTSSRYQARLTASAETYGNPAANIEPARATMTNTAFPRYSLNSLTTGAVRNGVLRPGDTSDRREIVLSNTGPTGNVRLSRCPLESGGCGTIFSSLNASAIVPFPEPPHVDPATGNPLPGQDCPYCGTQVARFSTGARWEGDASTIGGRYASYPPEGMLGQPMVAPETNAARRWSEAFATMRPVIPDAAVMFGSPTSSVAAGGALPFWVQLAVPPNQPASEPGDTGSNSLANNFGYRGWAAVYHPTSALNPEDRNDSYDDNDAWDAYLVCPDCGDPQEPHGVVCTVCGRWYPAGTPTCNLGHAAAPTVAGVLPSSPHRMPCQRATDCPGHQFCPLCGCVWGADLDHDGDVLEREGCPFCGYAPSVPLHLIRVGPNSTEANPNPAPSEVTGYTAGDDLWYQVNVGHRDVLPEEYDLFDLHATVDKAVEVASNTPSTDAGRVAPGVNMWAPDFTVGAPPPGRRADPYNASHWAGFAMGNRGNTVPPMDPITGAWYRLFRPDAHVAGRAPGWASVRDPIASVIKYPYYENKVVVGGVEQLVPLMGTPGLPWKPLYPASKSVNAGEAEAITTVGNPGGAWDTVVGNGQLIGRYTGPLAYFQDLNANGVLDFLPYGAAVPTTSDVAMFDPDRDTALEPYMATQVNLRVRESRLPYNDYFAKDTSPTPWVAYNAGGQPIGLQAMWMTDSIGGGTPSPQAPVNIRVASATASTTATGERHFEWQAGTTALSGSTGAFAQNGPVATYADDVGNQWALWPATDRSSGTFRSGIVRVSGSAGAWGAQSLIWTGQEKAQCVSGFYDPGYAGGPGNVRPAHWSFWITGPKGQEKAMYRVDFLPLGAGGFLMGTLPLDNSISPTDPAPVVATWVDGDGEGPSRDVRTSVRRFPRGPFSAIKDLKAALYLPPNVYATTNTVGDEDALRGATQPQIRVFFAGYSRNRQNYDIYEARFDLWRLLAEDPDPTTGDFNHGRLVIGDHQDTSAEGMPPSNPEQVAAGMPADYIGEELTPDAMSQEFTSIHPDWRAPQNMEFGGGGVTLYLGVKLQGVPANIEEVQYYDVIWGCSSAAQVEEQRKRGQRYDEKRGVYHVIPRFYKHKDDAGFYPLPPDISMEPPAAFLIDERELIDPNSAKIAGPGEPLRPVAMEVDPTLGTVRFSAPLFNPLNPADESCVFNTVDIPSLEDVFLCSSYEPYLLRLTESPADDDCPNPLYQSGPWNGNAPAALAQSYPWELHGRQPNLLLLWRRKFAPDQAPYYGRTCYMMKQESWSFQVNYPPIQGAKGDPVVTAWPAACLPSNPGAEMVGPGMPTEDDDNVMDPATQQLPSPARNEYDVDMANGVFSIWHGAFRFVEINYAGYRGTSGTMYVHSPVLPGHGITVEYTGCDGQVHTETHRVGGWSDETIVPIDTVLAEGPLGAVEENYTVPWTPGAPAGDPVLAARRYWVFWSSPRPLYDLRLPAAGGSGVGQSWDLYHCAIAPEFPTLARERWVWSRASDRFRPPYY